MECPICLEAIDHGSDVGRIQECLHEYHKTCILQWSEHSNSCPTCRKPYHAIDMLKSGSPQVVLHCVSVQDRLLHNDAINHIPSEYVIPRPVYGNVHQSQRDVDHREDTESASAGVCLVCSSSSYSMRHSPMVSCISCGGKFHIRCLGTSDDVSWFCPVCDCYHELPAPVYRRSRWQSRPTTGATPSYAHHPEANVEGYVAAGAETTAGVSSVLEEDFEDAGTVGLPARCRAAVWNGGVLLRRRARELQSMTPEVASSWHLLESARNGSSDDAMLPVSSAPVHSGPTRKRRRGWRNRSGLGSEQKLDPSTSSTPQQTNGMSRPIANVPAESAADSVSGSSSEAGICTQSIGDTSESQNTAPSRIASLIRQIKTRHPSGSYPSSENSHLAQVRSADSPYPPMLASSSVSTLASSPASSSETENSPDKAPDGSVLTFEEKEAVQRHVRSWLLPLYRGNGSQEKRINSEDEYIHINKSVSRQIYSHISNSRADGYESEGGFFDESNGILKSLVRAHVEGWTLK